MERAEFIRELFISAAILVAGYGVTVGFAFAVFRLAFPFKKTQDDKISELKSIPNFSRPRTLRAGKMNLSHG